MNVSDMLETFTLEKIKAGERILPSILRILHPSWPEKLAVCSGKIESVGTLSNKLSPQSFFELSTKSSRFSFFGSFNPQ